ncbi:MAG: methanogenesis marker 17 protein [Candidatus Methanomethylophilaceae archaeon]|nr:methanogenesis marker 17 protein [Candidatus Methanomethylophilaceae archaeon]
MQVEVVGTDPYGDEAYKALFEGIIGDIGKTFMIEGAKLVLKPEVPLFIFSVVLRNVPGGKTISNVASLRQEREDLHMSISEERYAPDVLAQLWKIYGRSKVEQQTRFDLVIHGGKAEEVESIPVSSGEAVIKEILGAVWRALPEGIRNREVFIDDRVVTVTATEEIMLPEFLKEGRDLHDAMVAEARRSKDV